jgi:hypothetical protein
MSLEPRVMETLEPRLEYGYTPGKNCTVTGKVKAALYRSPLVLKPVLHPLREGFRIQLNVGTDSQFLYVS